VNGQSPVLFLAKFVAYKNKFDIGVWPNIQFLIRRNERLEKVRHIDRIEEVKTKFKIPRQKIILYYRKIVTMQLPKYLSLIHKAKTQMKNLYSNEGSSNQMVHTNSIHIGARQQLENALNQRRAGIRKNPIAQKPAPIAAPETLENPNMSNQDRINQLNNGSRSNLEVY
jgi:hypothetical protein